MQNFNLLIYRKDHCFLGPIIVNLYALKTRLPVIGMNKKRCERVGAYVHCTVT